MRPLTVASRISSSVPQDRVFFIHALSLRPALRSDALPSIASATICSRFGRVVRFVAKGSGVSQDEGAADVCVRAPRLGTCKPIIMSSVPTRRAWWLSVIDCRI